MRNVTAEALRAKIDRKSAILLQRGQFDQQFSDDDHLRLIEKRVVDFLLVLIELFR